MMIRLLRKVSETYRLLTALLRGHKRIKFRRPSSNEPQLANENEGGRIMGLSFKGFSHANSEHPQNEDAWYVDGWRAAIADGVTMSIFQSEWAQILTQSFVTSDCQLDDQDNIQAWIDSCRRHWSDNVKAMIEKWEKDRERYWSQLRLYRLNGASATFLGVEFRPMQLNPTCIEFKAWAVGDCCLLHFHRNELHCSFPVENPSEFGIFPEQIQSHHWASHPQFKSHSEEFHSNTDFVVLATDSIAAYLLKERPWEKDEDFWGKIENMSEEDWTEWTAKLERDKILHPDDHTLVLLWVGQRMPYSISELDNWGGDSSAVSHH